MLNSFNKKLKSLTQSNRYGTLTHSQRAVFSRHGNASGEGLLLLSPIFGHHRQPAEAVFLKLGFRGHLESRIGHAGALRRERRFRGARLGPVVFLGLGGVGDHFRRRAGRFGGLPAAARTSSGLCRSACTVLFRNPAGGAGPPRRDNQRGGAALRGLRGRAFHRRSAADIFSFSLILYREDTDTVSNRQRWTAAGGREPP